MDFALSEEQQQIFTMARDFATEKMAPFADTWEVEKRLPRDVNSSTVIFQKHL